MTFGLSAAAVAGIGAVAATGASLYSTRQQGKAAGRAAELQSQAADRGIDEQQRQFDAIRELLKPYTDGGPGALTGQQDIAGLNGENAQQAAIAAIQRSPQFMALQQQGENAILQNASATGGLRGGNTQAALAQFSPQLLSQLIDQQYSRLGGLTSLGQNAAAGVGNAGMQTGNNIAQLMQQQGAALAGGALAQGRTQAGYANAISNGLGMFLGGGKF